MLKFNNKNTRAMSLTFWCLIVNFEQQVNVTIQYTENKVLGLP